MRSKDEHARHCAYTDRRDTRDAEKEHYSKVYGINYTSALCDIPYFDVTQQLSQDVMHLLLEGNNIGLLHMSFNH